MNSPPYMPLWIGDFHKKTSFLDARETGAYMLLIMTLWTCGGKLPSDQKKLQRVAKCGREWPKVWGAISQYFEDADGFITQHRVTEELQKCATKREVNAHNGARGGSAKALKSKEASLANDTVSLQRNPSISESESDIEEKREAKASPQKSRGSRLSDDWFLPQDWGEWALGEGLEREAIKLEADRFRDYWHSKAGKDAVKVDWLATWRNWIRTAKDRKSGPPRSSKENANGQSDRRQFDAAINETARLLSAGTIVLDHSSRDPFATR